MGLFDKIFKAVPEEDKLTKQEAFAGIAVAMAGADGSIAESEWDGICNYLRRLRLYDNFADAAFSKKIDKILRISGIQHRRSPRRLETDSLCLCSRHRFGRWRT